MIINMPSSKKGLSCGMRRNCFTHRINIIFIVYNFDDVLNNTTINVNFISNNYLKYKYLLDTRSFFSGLAKEVYF